MEYLLGIIFLLTVTVYVLITTLLYCFDLDYSVEHYQKRYLTAKFDNDIFCWWRCKMIRRWLARFAICLIATLSFSYYVLTKFL